MILLFLLMSISLVRYVQIKEIKAKPIIIVTQTIIIINHRLVFI